MIWSQRCSPSPRHAVAHGFGLPLLIAMADPRRSLRPGDALILVDLQIDFCPGGALPIQHGDEVISVLNRWIAAAVQGRIPVVLFMRLAPSRPRQLPRVEWRVAAALPAEQRRGTIPSGPSAAGPRDHRHEGGATRSRPVFGVRRNRARNRPAKARCDACLDRRPGPGCLRSRHRARRAARGIRGNRHRGRHTSGDAPRRPDRQRGDAAGWSPDGDDGRIIPMANTRPHELALFTDSVRAHHDAGVSGRAVDRHGRLHAVCSAVAATPELPARLWSRAIAHPSRTPALHRR